MSRLTPASTPRLPRGVRLHRDLRRERWMLLAPERAFEIDDIAAAVVGLCDGARSLEAIVTELADRYAADPTEIATDVTAMLDDLAEKRVLDP
jgi:pyrroloquinoline quinone biosynthesis protein D